MFSLCLRRDLQRSVISPQPPPPCVCVCVCVCVVCVYVWCVCMCGGRGEGSQPWRGFCCGRLPASCKNPLKFAGLLFSRLHLGR